MNISGNNFMDEYSNQMLEDMYPEVYHAVYPMIRQKALQVRGQNINTQMLDSMVNDIMWNSGLMDEEWSDAMMETGMDMEDAVPTAEFGFDRRRRPPFRQPMRRHRRFFANDLVRILFLRELLGR